eukprot:12315314-Ditylum_brightwellii.AAC.1
MKHHIAHMADHYNKELPFKFCKLDIKDGFRQLVVNPATAWNFYYVSPQKDGKLPENIDNINLVVLFSIQLGWLEPPPYFCSGSETLHIVIQELSQRSDMLVKHTCEYYMLPRTFAHKAPPSQLQAP